MNETLKARYWFHTRRYGWGWGLPATWEGWLVMGLYLGGMVAGGSWLLPRLGEAAFLGWTGLLTTLLLLVCWRKGPPPVWHWGDK